ncbi:YSIRK-type signal peptide-containing protein, partial [Streptococcus pluranimalium]|uniref:YSIRK-type signal peptide-containing protein n=1 Tax=Streptococcus pluranimalium TaxID=82348 RepID=UPI0039FD072F
MTKRRHKSFDWHGISQRFSLRKYHFGAASVLLGTAVILGAAAGATSVSADTTSALVSPSTLEPTPSTDQATIEQPTAPAAQSSETPAQALSQPVPAPQSVAPEAQTPHLAPIAKAGLVFSTSLTPEDFLTNSADLKAQGATISFTDGQPSPDATSVSLKVVYRDGTERLLQIPVILEKRSVDILVAEQVQPISEATELEVNVDQTETETTPGKKRVKRALTNPKNQTNLPYFNVATKEILKESIQKALPNDSNHPEYYKDGLKFGHSFTDSGKIGIGEEDKENQYTFSYYNRYNEKVTFKLISTTMPQKEASFANAVQIDGAAGHSKHTASTTHYQEYAKNALIETGGRGESVYEINIEGREKLGLVALRPYLPVNYATSYQKMEVKFSHANILAVGLHNLPRDNFYFEEKKIDGLESSELYTTPVAKNTEDGVEFVAHSMDTHDLRYGASPEEKKEFLQTKKESNKNLSQDSVAVLTNSPTIRMTVKKVQSTTLNSIERYDALKRTGYDSVQSPEYQYDIFLGLNGGVWNRLELSDKVNVKNASNLSESEKETIIQAIKNSDYIKKKGNYSGVRRIVVTQEGDAQLIFHPDYKTIVIPKESLITESPALEVPVIAPIDSDDRTISITLKTEATDKSQVVVTIDDVPVEADKISVVGTDVTVTLDRPLTAGQTVGVVQTSPTQKDSPKAVAQVAKTASETAQDGKKDPVKVPVKDATNVSEDEKAKIKEAIKVAYPNLPGTETIDVNQDGSARITFVDGSA